MSTFFLYDERASLVLIYTTSEQACAGHYEVLEPLKSGYVTSR